MARTQVFICYSREDDRWRAALREQLTPFAGERGPLDVWDDTAIEAGVEWRAKIADALATAKVGVLFVSPASLASEFITREEIPALLEAAVTRGARLLCVYARPSLVHRLEYEFTDPTTGERLGRLLTDFQGPSVPEHPLSSLSEHEAGALLTRVAEAVLAVAEGRDTASSPGRPRPVTDPRGYLQWLRDDTRRLEMRGIGAKVAEHVELERVYTRLRVAAPPRAEVGEGIALRGPLDASVQAADTRTRDTGLSELLCEHRDLVLVGDPGAGKTTFLRFVALNLARALLGEERDACLERVGLQPGIDGVASGESAASAPEPPFPVFVRLGSFGQFLNQHPREDLPPEAPAHFYRQLDFLCRGFDPPLPEGFLRERVQAGGCLLLLDGLDEVPGDTLRERVGAIIDRVVAAGRARGNRHVVTCRTRAYQGKVQLGQDFVRATLLDFGPDQIREFATQWSRALFRVSPGTASGHRLHEADTHCRKLLGAIRAHPHVQPLTVNPLLLTILAVVHWSKKKLPEQRADLYQAALDYLLETRDKQSPHPVTLRKDGLKAVALRLFEDPQGVRKTLGRREAALAVAPLLGGDLRQAEALVEDEELHSGILVSRVQGEVEFWHATFAEYLAAAALALQPDYWERIRAHLFDERWSEVVLLLAGCRRAEGLRFASHFIDRILALAEPAPTEGSVRRWLVRLFDRGRERERAALAGRGRAVALVGRILRDILPAGGDPAQGTAYAEARRQVLGIFEPGSAVALSVRIEVGEALGQAGDPRLEGDPWVVIDGGRYPMGGDADAFGAGPARTVEVAPFRIGRWPVTVAEYSEFVAADDSGDEQWWRGLREREGHKAWQEPDEWSAQVRHPNRPVVGVSWWEAMAYARWRSAHTAPPGEVICLPTAAEWEAAARGRTGDRFPWGDADPGRGDQARANYHWGDGSPGGTTPVGMFPGGHRGDLWDLAGNVWEWCHTPWDDGDHTRHDADTCQCHDDDRRGERVNRAVPRVVRGGSWNFPAWYLRAACRDWSVPASRDWVLGFRVVCRRLRQP